jgi:hypothetical protein
MLALDLAQFLEQSIELAIADLGGGLHIVEVVVTMKLAAQPGRSVGDVHGFFSLGREPWTRRSSTIIIADSRLEAVRPHR